MYEGVGPVPLTASARVYRRPSQAPPPVHAEFQR
jgi:hypothetical protein